MARRSAYCRAAFGRQQMHHRARPKPPSRPRSTTTVSGTPRAFSSAFSVCSARRGAAPTVGLRAAGGRCCRFAVTVAAAFRTGCETASTATAVVWIRDCAALSPTWNEEPTGTGSLEHSSGPSNRPPAVSKTGVVTRCAGRTTSPVRDWMLAQSWLPTPLPLLLPIVRRRPGFQLFRLFGAAQGAVPWPCVRPSCPHFARPSEAVPPLLQTRWSTSLSSCTCLWIWRLSLVDYF